MISPFTANDAAMFELVILLVKTADLMSFVWGTVVVRTVVDVELVASVVVVRSGSHMNVFRWNGNLVGSSLMLHR